MRVLIDGRMFRGRMHGLARYVHATVEAMARQAPDWTFGVLEREGAWAGLAAALPNVEPVPVRSDPFRLGEHLEIGPLARAWNPGLFHAPTIAVPRGIRCRLVVTVPDLTPLHFPRRGAEKLYFRFLLAPALRRASRVLVYSGHTADDVARNLGVPRERIDVTPLGVDPDLSRARSPEEIGQLRERLGLRPGYVLCLANPKPHKNVAVLLEAWRRARPEADLALVCAEAGWLREAAAGLEGLRRLDHVPEGDLAALYQGASALVIPSLYEGFGLPAAEAMAAGTPVISARAASLPEVVGEEALLFDASSADELAAALRRILADPRLREDLSARGRARARRWTWEETARLHLLAYRRSLR